MSIFGMKYHQRLEVEQMIKDAGNKKKNDIKGLNKETSTKQQLLILHYMGVLDSLKINETTKKATLFSALLNRDKQNIRQILTYIDARKIDESEIKTVENLNAIIPLFEEVGLSEALEKIRADLSKLKIV